MFFLVEYDRKKKVLIKCDEYSDKEAAWKARFELEKNLIENNRCFIETVVFEADNKYTLKHTHSRYFKNLSEFQKNFKDVMKVIKEEKGSLKKIQDTLGLISTT